MGLLSSVPWRKIWKQHGERAPQELALSYVLGRRILEYILVPEGRDHVCASAITHNTSTVLGSVTLLPKEMKKAGPLGVPSSCYSWAHLGRMAGFTAALTAPRLTDLPLRL